MSEGRKPIILVLEINQGVVFDIAEVFFNRRERFELRSIVISLCMPAARAVLLPTRSHFVRFAPLECKVSDMDDRILCLTEKDQAKYPKD